MQLILELQRSLWIIPYKYLPTEQARSIATTHLWEISPNF